MSAVTAVEPTHSPASSGPASEPIGWVWMTVAYGVTGASQLATQLLLGRSLGAADFGQVATLINLMSLVGVPLVALQITVTGMVARGGSAAATLRRQMWWGLLAGALALLTASWWGGALRISSVDACRVTALFLPATFLLSVTRGNALGRGHTRAVALAMLVAAVVRVVVSAVGVTVLGPVGAAGGAVAAEAILGLLLLGSLRSASTDPARVGLSEMSGAAYSQVAMWIVINVDLLWARRLLDPADAGRYLAVGGVSLGIVSLGQAVLWHNAAATTDPAFGRRVVARSAAMVAVVALVALPPAAIVLPWLLGAEFAGVELLFVGAGCWAVFASVVHAGTTTQLISGRRGLQRLVPTALLAVAIPPIAVALFGHRPIVLSIAGVANTAVGALVVIWPGRSNRSGRRAALRERGGS